MKFKQRIDKLEQVLCPRDDERPIICVSFVALGQEHTRENTYVLIDEQLISQQETCFRNIIIFSEEDALL
jgi:hypothetical protein